METHRYGHLDEALMLAQKMNSLADQSEVAAKDDGCAVLAGVIRDCAHKIRRRAEAEIEVHKASLVWETVAAGRSGTGERQVL